MVYGMAAPSYLRPTSSSSLFRPVPDRAACINATRAHSTTHVLLQPFQRADAAVSRQADDHDVRILGNARQVGLDPVGVWVRVRARVRVKVRARPCGPRWQGLGLGLGLGLDPVGRGGKRSCVWRGWHLGGGGRRMASALAFGEVGTLGAVEGGCMGAGASTSCPIGDSWSKSEYY